mgnify:CR=1 FL=1
MATWHCSQCGLAIDGGGTYALHTAEDCHRQQMADLRASIAALEGVLREAVKCADDTRRRVKELIDSERDGDYAVAEPPWVAAARAVLGKGGE